jgi:hypothetical protein
MKKRFLFLACAACVSLFALSGCAQQAATGESVVPSVSASDSVSVSASASVSDSVSDSVPDSAVSEAPAVEEILPTEPSYADEWIPLKDSDRNVPTPDFLTEEQVYTYLAARKLFCVFSIETSDIDYKFCAPGTDLNATTQIERDGMWYSNCVGYFSRWVDFKAACLSVFTEEYFNYLINSADNMPPQFINVDGDLYYWCGSRGVRGYWPDLYPETFELVEQTDNFIAFNMHSHLVDGDNFSWDLDYTLTMEKTENGWRFSNFGLPY